MFLDRVIDVGKALDDRVRGRSRKNQESFNVFPNDVHVKVILFGLNMTFISSRQRVLPPSYPFR